MRIVSEGSNKNNYNDPGSGGTGGSGKVKSSIDDDSVQGREFSRPTTFLGNNNLYELY